MRHLSRRAEAVVLRRTDGISNRRASMARYRQDLPQRKNALFLSDGGMETTLIFHHGVALPHFASFVLLDTPEGRKHLIITRRISQSRARMVWGSCWIRRHGVRILIGSASSVMTLTD